MIRKSADTVFLFYTIAMFIVTQIKRARGFSNVKKRADFTSKSIDDSFFLKIKIRIIRFFEHTMQLSCLAILFFFEHMQ